MVIDKVLALFVLAACVLLLLRLAVGARRRQRFDAALRRAWGSLRRHVVTLWNWRSTQRNAERVAAETIRRARGAVERDGNVYKPKSFRGPRKPH